MQLRRFEPESDAGALRRFLVRGDPEDYLLADLDAWTRVGRGWVGVDGDEWVAFGRLEELGRLEGWISAMRVDPGRQRSGLGKQLLGGLLADAASLGLQSLRAVIEDRNEPSRRLFGALGFHESIPLSLRQGLAVGTGSPSLRAARSSEVPTEVPYWAQLNSGLIDLLPGDGGGRFGTWHRSLASGWASEGKLFAAEELAVAVRPDWGTDPRTLWVVPVSGAPERLFPALGGLCQTLGHEAWLGFLPGAEEFRHRLDRSGSAAYPAWGAHVHLFEREVPRPAVAPGA